MSAFAVVDNHIICNLARAVFWLSGQIYSACDQESKLELVVFLIVVNNAWKALEYLDTCLIVCCRMRQSSNGFAERRYVYIHY